MVQSKSTFTLPLFANFAHLLDVQSSNRIVKTRDRQLLIRFLLHITGALHSLRKKQLVS